MPSAARTKAVGGPLDGMERAWPAGSFMLLDDKGRRTRTGRHLYKWGGEAWEYAGHSHLVCACGSVRVRPVFPDTPCPLCGHSEVA